MLGFGRLRALFLLPLLAGAPGCGQAAPTLLVKLSGLQAMSAFIDITLSSGDSEVPVRFSRNQNNQYTSEPATTMAGMLGPGPAQASMAFDLPPGTSGIIKVAVSQAFGDPPDQSAGACGEKAVTGSGLFELALTVTTPTPTCP